MFGFITPNMNDLSEEEQDRYKEFYCGQCHTLGQRLGQHTRLTLSHDMTFMAILLTSLYEPTEKKTTSGCVMQPFKPRTWTQCEYVEYAADMTCALMFHKLLDNKADDGSTIAAVGSHILKPAYQQVQERWPRQCTALEEGLQAIAAIEKQQATPDSPGDAAANIFGMIMGELFALKDDFWTAELKAFGAQLGRFIYMMDAAVDLEEDKETGSFNPFADKDISEEDLEFLLMTYMQGVTEVFERLPLEQDVHILRNILYSGVWGTYNKKKQETSSEEEDSSLDERSAHE